jgi:hypothetical protein
VIKNGQSRDTGNIGYRRHRTKTNKTKNTTQKTKKDDPQKTGGVLILIPKLCVLHELFPFKVSKIVPFMQSSMKITYIFPIICSKF